MDLLSMDSNYLMAWSIYLGAVIAAMILVWLPLRRWVTADTRRLLLLCLFALLITPERVDPDHANWAPAFMAALMEAIDSGFHSGLNRLWPALVLALVLVVLSMLWRLRSPKSSGDS